MTRDADGVLAVGDHLAPTTDTHEPGVYRVVGHGDGTVTLLRVGDADGRRVHTGEIHTAPAGGDEFEQTTAPRPPSLATSLTEPVRDVIWERRAFLATLRRRPARTALAALPLVIAVAVDGRLSGAVVGGLVIVGSLALAAVGSGRLGRLL